MKFDNELAGVKWSAFQAEHPQVYARIKSYVNRGKVTFLPDDEAIIVMRWIADQRAKAKAEADAERAKVELEAKRKAVQDAITKNRNGEEYRKRHDAEAEQLHRRLAGYRLTQWCEERGLEPIPENAAKVVWWCQANGGINEANVDRAIQALSSQLSWSTFAAKLRA